MQTFLYIRVSPLALYNGTQSIHQCVVDIYHYMSHIIYIYKQIPLSSSTTYGAGEDKLNVRARNVVISKGPFQQCCGRQTIVQGQCLVEVHTRAWERRPEIKYENTVYGRQGRRRRSLYRTVIIMFSPDQITTPRERTKPLGNRFFLSIFLILYYMIFFSIVYAVDLFLLLLPIIVCARAKWRWEFCVHGTLENRNILKIII